MRALSALVVLPLAMSGCAALSGSGQPVNPPPPIVTAIADTAAQIALREALKPACAELYVQIERNAATTWPAGVGELVAEQEQAGLEICRKTWALGEEVLAADPPAVLQLNASLEDTRKAIRSGFF